MKGWNSQVYRGFPGNVESSNFSRDNVSREIGHIIGHFEVDVSYDFDILRSEFSTPISTSIFDFDS